MLLTQPARMLERDMVLRPALCRGLGKLLCGWAVALKPCLQQLQAREG